jgi:hypothetical protein
VNLSCNQFIESGFRNSLAAPHKKKWYNLRGTQEKSPNPRSRNQSLPTINFALDSRTDGGDTGKKRPPHRDGTKDESTRDARKD